MRRTTFLTAISLMGTAFGCDGSHALGGLDGGDGQAQDSAATDGGNGADAAIGCVPGPAPTEAHAVTFRFRNGGPTILYLDTMGDCGNLPAFSLTRCPGEGALRILAGCTLCECERCTAQSGCGACPGCAFRDRLEVQPGKAIDFQWSGHLLATEPAPECLSGQCWTRQAAPTGTYQLAVAVRDTPDGPRRTTTLIFEQPVVGGTVDVNL